MRKYFLLHMFFISLVWTYSCDSGSQGLQDQRAGTIRVQMEWPQGAAFSTEQFRTALDCTATKVANLRASVMDSEKLLVQGGPWRCELGEGSIQQVPAGDNRKVILYAYDAHDVEIYRGEASNVQVRQGQIANVDIKMSPVFNHAITLVGNVGPGTESSFPHRLTKFKDQLLFIAKDGDKGFEIFIEGDGVQLLKDIYPFSDSSDLSGVAAPSDFVELNDWLYFRANDGSGYSIWRTDGTSANTAPVAIAAGYANPAELTVLNNQIFFSAESNAAGRELWVFDESTGIAQMVYDIKPGEDSSNPQDLTVMDNELYYVADDGQHGYEIWRTRPAADTTHLTADLYVGTESSFPTELLVVDERLFFVAYNGEQHSDHTPPTYNSEVWMLNTTTDGDIEVQLTADLNPQGSSRSKNLKSIDNTTLAFSAYEQNTGQELYLYNWRTDTAPRRITDMNPNTASSHPSNFLYINGMLYFTAHNNNGVEHLWVYALDQSQPVTCITATAHYIAPRHLTAFGQSVYFSGYDGSGTRKLWVTDGVRIGLVVNVNGGATKQSPANFLAFTDRLYLTAFDTENGEEVFELSTQ